VRRVSTLLLTGSVVAALAGVAQADSFRKGPYLQNAQKTGVTVMWESDQPEQGKVIVRSPVRPDVVVEETEPSRMHEVRVDGLEPGKRYTYTVESGGERQGGEFVTAPLPGEAFSFVAFGDSRSNANAHRAVVERVLHEVPDFILGTGDMVNEGPNQADWQQFFDVERDLLRDNVLWPSLGNHDREPRPRRTAESFRRYFSVPDDSPDPERYYAFTYGNSRFLVLDSNAYSFSLTDQTAWIERELQRAAADPTIKHVFVSMHHPPYSTSVHGGQVELRDAWTPLYEKYHVDAVFSGHDHTYEHSYVNGVHYVVTGGGGAPLYARDPYASKLDKEASLYFERTYNYLRVQVVGDFVEVSAMRVDGTLIESFSWGKLPEPVAAAPQAAPEAGGTRVASATAAAVPAGAPAGAAGGCAVGGRGAVGGGGWLALLGVMALRGWGRARRRSS
jgi:3',5'-cyclic AMP phosphodiesterase CpdA